jgi:hypothetical protein
MRNVSRDRASATSKKVSSGETILLVVKHLLDGAAVGAWLKEINAHIVWREPVVVGQPEFLAFRVREFVGAQNVAHLVNQRGAMGRRKHGYTSFGQLDQDSRDAPLVLRMQVRFWLI